MPRRGGRPRLPVSALPEDGTFPSGTTAYEGEGRLRELRYRVLRDAHPEEAERLLALAEAAVEQRWQSYEELATRGAARFPADARRS